MAAVRPAAVADSAKVGGGPTGWAGGAAADPEESSGLAIATLTASLKNSE